MRATSPRAAYALLAQEPWRGEVDWQRVRVFFGDERCVPPANAESNYKMADDTLLSKVPLPAQSVHRMRGEDDPAEAAQAYATLLIALLGEEPHFDLLLLGMGPDGHTASLFPGSDPRTDEAQLVRAVWVEKLKTHRITLTPAAINDARHIVIACEGAAKAEMLHEVREGAYDPAAHPVQIVSPASGLLEWFADRAAARRSDCKLR
ncbi:MAG: 6-phosphogluconolactonase [Candidatus Baltobacteraceae bacterium]